MPEFVVEFTKNNCACMVGVEAADLAAAKVAAKQWRATALAYRDNDRIRIIKISPKLGNFLLQIVNKPC